eukprot:15256286-Alexandrium_andersonii.AAC.1
MRPSAQVTVELFAVVRPGASEFVGLVHVQRLRSRVIATESLGVRLRGAWVPSPDSLPGCAGDACCCCR